MPKRNLLPLDTVAEIVALYNDGEPVKAINESYGFKSDGTLYRLLKLHGITPRSKREREGKVSPMVKFDAVSKEEAANAFEWAPRSVKFDIDASQEEAARAFSSAIVKVDKNDTVQSITKIERKKNLVVWKITFEGTLMMEGESIFEALNEAKKLPMVQRIVGASIAEMSKE